ncbi:hypothetical protein [Pseudomonas fluorescens]|uniref:hypothetical protein n=1 Tax=Pseudomonas fluorescens TaxID=294 RepID=UPI001F290DF0|nr:hypothetical protein [Pseudomonas fluorescens]
MLFHQIFSCSPGFVTSALRRITNKPATYRNTLFICTVLIEKLVMTASDLPLKWTIPTWLSFLQDEAALLRHPGAHYKVLVEEAHALHKAQMIDRAGLSDLLEQADSALAYAVEELLDERRDE